MNHASPQRLHCSWLYAASAAGIIVSGVYISSVYPDDAPSSGPASDIVVVAGGTPTQKAALPRNDTIQGGLNLANTPLPDGQTIARHLAVSLPTLKEIVTDCSGASCTVSAKTVGSRTGGDQQGLEHMVSADIPAVLSQAGYTLTEPLQIEETGADETRILLQISTAR